jgi:hypothetical protein
MGTRYLDLAVGVEVAGIIPNTPEQAYYDQWTTDSQGENEGGVAVRVAARPLRQQRRLHRSGADRIHSNVPLTQHADHVIHATFQDSLDTRTLADFCGLKVFCVVLL